MSERPKILVVDDESAIRRFLKVSLQAHHYRVVEAETGQQALERAAAERPEAIILDLGLPDFTGIEVTRQLREWSTVPILFLSVQGQERDKIGALDAGADDYLTKPFSVEELLARLRAALRRAHSQVLEAQIHQCGELCMDLRARTVTIHGQPVTLTPTEWSLLETLIRNAGRVLTHRQLLREVWGDAYQGESHLVRVNVYNLRRKLETDPIVPRYIRTEPGVGYRLTDAR